MVPRLIWICKMQWWYLLLLFYMICRYAKFNKQNSMVVFTVLIYTGNTLFGQICSQNSEFQFKLKPGTKTNSSIQNSMVVLTFSVSEWKYPFWANLVQKIKIISWCWNLVPWLIQICRIQWWCCFFLFLIRNTLLGKSGPKN